MLRSIKNTFGYPIEARDGLIGSVKDCLFDDRHWRLRYLVADTRKWLPGRKVLISPHQAKQPELGWQGKRFPVELDKDQIRNAPPLEEDAPVSAQYEEEYARYYRHIQPYWSGAYPWGGTSVPVYFPPEDDGSGPLSKSEQEAHQRKLEKIEHSHLHSAREVFGYEIHARDDSFGHVEDFIVDDEKWKLQYLVIDTRHWLPGKKRLVDIDWIETFDWPSQSATVSLSRKQIEAAPDYDPSAPINRDDEKRLYDYYGRPYHWEEPHVTPPPA